MSVKGSLVREKEERKISNIRLEPEIREVGLNKKGANKPAGDPDGQKA